MKVTECENKWCIYYGVQGEMCSHITINSFGMCESCMMIDPDDTELKMLRRRKLDSLGEYD